MIEIGRHNCLRAERRAEPGFYLTDGHSEVLLPNRLVPPSLRVGEELDVFVYTDSADRPVATTQRPLAEVGDFACLRVVGVGPKGAFMDWGLDKDLFVPHSHQPSEMAVGEHHVVYVRLDPRSDRPMATAKIEAFLEPAPAELTPGEAVDLLVCRWTPLGAQVVVEQRYSGLLYRNEVFQPLEIGQELTGYVRKLREDGKLDLTLRPAGGEARASDSEALLRALEAAGGHLALGDSSSPEEIARTLSMSKKAFKRALGGLYRRRLVTLGADGIRSVAQE